MPTILITGTTSGIGEASVHAFLGAGWEVLATYRPERGDPWSGIPRVTGLPLDLLDGDSIASLAARVTELDVLYCNAGYVLAGPVETCTVDQTREQFEANVFGHLDLVQRLLPVLRRSQLRDDDRAGILWTCSISAEAAMPFMGNYSATKGAICAYAEALSIELADQKLWSKALFPAAVATPIYQKLRFAPEFPQEYSRSWSHLVNQVDAMRASPPEDVAKVALEAVMDGDESKVRYHPTADAKAVPLSKRTMGQDAFWATYRTSILHTPGKLVEFAMKALIPTDSKPVDIKLAPQAVVSDIEPGDPAYPGHEKHVA